MSIKIVNNGGCYIGCRVSSIKQAQQGESLEDQENVCELKAKNLSSPVIKVYSVQHSATKVGDSFIDDILEDIKKQPVRGSFFIIKSIDRFCRAGIEEYNKLKSNLEELGIQLVDAYGVIQPKVNTMQHLGVEYDWSKQSPSEGSEIMEAHNSNKEVSKILTRMIGAEIGLVREGYKIRPPEDGFLNERVYVEGKKKVIMIPDPVRAIYFTTMFEMRASGAYSDLEIINHLNAMGYLSKPQKRWSKDKKTVIGSSTPIKLSVKQLQKIIQRPIYAGINTEIWLVAPIKTQWQGLVSIEIFNSANKNKLFIEELSDGSITIHKDYNPHQVKRMKDNPDFPHKSVVMCPICNKPFLGSISKGKSGQGFSAYHCSRQHTRSAVSKKEFEAQLTNFVSSLEYTDEDFLRSLEASLINKFREKEKELGEFSSKVGTNVIELEMQKKQKIEAFTSTQNAIIRAELEKQIDEIHTVIESARAERNSIEVRENDVHAFVGYVKELMEHPVEILVKQTDMLALKGLFGIVFDELPTYTQIVNGTPKLSLAYKLSKEFSKTKSLSVTPRRIELRLTA